MSVCKKFLAAKIDKELGETYDSATLSREQRIAKLTELENKRQKLCTIVGIRRSSKASLTSGNYLGFPPILEKFNEHMRFESGFSEICKHPENLLKICARFSCVSCSAEQSRSFRRLLSNYTFQEKICELMRNSPKIESGAVQTCVNLVDLVKSFPTSISLQNSASI